MTPRTALAVPSPRRLELTILPGNDRPRQWRHVDVCGLDASTALDDPAVVRVRAWVRLGAIRPSDARVELHVDRARGPVVGPACARMWSEHAYGDGRYGFIARVPDAVVRGADALTVHVHPAQGPGSGGEPAAVASIGMRS